MKVSVVSQILSGASAVSAAACPHVVHIPFTTKFEVVTLEEAQAKAANDPGFIEYQASLGIDVGLINVNVTLDLNTTLPKLPLPLPGLGGGYPTADDKKDEPPAPPPAPEQGSTYPTAPSPGSSYPVGSGSSYPTKPLEGRAEGCTNPAIRVEWRNMKDADKKSFVNAVTCLMDKEPIGISNGAAKNLYEELVYAHQQQHMAIHQAASFLPWHRYYTHLFSRLLRQECGYQAPFPWWDETKDSGNFTNSGLFTPEYFGTLRTVSQEGQGSCVTDGAFAGRVLHIGPDEQNTEHCLARGEDPSVTSNVNKVYVDTCNSRTTYADMRECVEFGPHGYGHNGLGPVMAAVSGSPSDPAFFMHHAFIDRNWKTWQLKKPERNTNISGCAEPGSPCPQLTLQTTLSSLGIRPNVTVGDVLDTENEWLCYKYDY